MRFNKTRRLHQRNGTRRIYQKGGDRAATILEEYSGPYANFFKYLMFDPYIQNGSGSNSYLIAHRFWEYITTYFTDKKNIHFFDNLTPFLHDKDKRTELVTRLNPNYYDINNSTTGYKIYAEYINKYLKDYNHCLLLSGYVNNSGNGHAVCIFIQNMNPNTSNTSIYNVSIINSGEGLQYHAIDSDDKVVITYTNINKEKLDLLIRLDFVCNYSIKNRSMYFTLKLAELGVASATAASMSYGLSGQHVKPDNIYDNYISSIKTYKGDMTIGFFYDELFKILGPIDARDKSLDKHDTQQRSSSCSFFSIKYFLKYFVVQDESVFERFMAYIRSEELKKFKRDFDIIIPNSSYEITNSSNARNFITIAQIILKDYENEFSETEKTSYIHSICSVYSTPHNSIADIPYRIESTLNTPIDIQSILQALRVYNETPKTFESLYICLREIQPNNVEVGYSNPLLAPINPYYNIKLAYIKSFLRLRCIKQLYDTLNDPVHKKQKINKDYDIKTHTGYDLFNSSNSEHSINGLELYLLLGCILLDFTSDTPFTYTDRFPTGKFTNEKITNFVSNWYNDLPPTNIHKTPAYNTYVGLLPIRNIFLMIQQFIPLFFDNTGEKFLVVFDVKFKLDDKLEENGRDGIWLVSNRSRPVDVMRQMGVSMPRTNTTIKFLNEFNLLVNILNEGDFQSLDNNIDIKHIQSILCTNNLDKSLPLSDTLTIITSNVCNIYHNTSRSYMDNYISKLLQQLDLDTFIESSTKLNTKIFDFMVSILYIYRYDEMHEKFKWNPEINYPAESKMKSFFIDQTIYPLIRSFDNSRDATGYNVMFLYYMISLYKYENQNEFETYIGKLFTDILSESSVPPKKDYVAIIGKDINELFPTSYIYQKEVGLNTYLLNHKTESIIKHMDKTNIVTQEIDNVIYTLLKPESGIPSSLNYVYEKLIRYEQIFLWKTADNKIRIELKDSQSYFKYESNRIKFISNNEIYNVLTTYPAILGMWIYNMPNGFILEKEHNYYLLLIMENEYISKMYDGTRYWNEKSRKIDSSISEKMPNGVMYNSIKYMEHIIPLNHTLLSLKTNSIEDLSAAFFSFKKSQNNMAFFLIRQQFLIASENMKSNIYTIDIAKNTFFIPYWALFTVDEISPNLMNRKDIFTFQSISKIDYNFTKITDMDQYKKIKLFVEKFNELKYNFSGSNLSEMLQNFLNEFRYKCRSYDSTRNDPIYSTIIDGIYPDSNYTRNNKILTTDSDIILTSLILTNKHVANICEIYSKYYTQFYQNLIDLRFIEIIQKLHTIAESKESMKDIIKTCGRVLKEIELLDTNLIYTFDKSRSIVDILFELHTGYFLRAEQKTILDEIDKPENENTAYEILMGRGKTSTLTPMIILDTYLNKNTKNQSVVLPAHLVDSSYGILCNSLLMLPNIIIQRFPTSVKKESRLYSKYESSIKIISNVVMKELVLYSRIGGEWDSSKEHMFIFDEVDTLIHPLKSDLNIPFGEQIQHPYLDQIFDICFTTVTNYIYNMSVPQSSNETISIINPNSPGKFLYSQKIDFIQNGVKDDNIYGILQMKLNTVMHSINTSMKYNQAYGFGTYINSDPIVPIQQQKNFFVAIPYSANKSPVDGSEFTDFELSMMLTMLSYFQEKIRIEDIKLYITVIEKQLTSFNAAIKTNSTLKEAIYNIFYRDIIGIISIETLDTIRSTFKESKDITSDCKFIADEFNKLENINKKVFFLRTYLYTIIFKYFFKISLDQSNISMVDIYSPTVSHKKVSFSGTVNFNAPGDIIQNNLLNGPVDPRYYAGQMNQIKIDEVVGGSIEASVLGVTTNPPTLIPWDKQDQDTVEKILLQQVIDANGKYSALIDAGGLILSRSPLQVIKYIEASLTGKTILYVDNTGKRQIYKESGSVPYNNEVFSNLFIYYDHKHCVGIDFKQPFEMKGLVTIANKSTLTDIAQGIFRLRGINIGHFVDFYYDRSIPAITTSIDLFTYLQRNDENMKTSTLSPAKLQCAKYVHRVNQGYNNESYDEKIFYDTLKLPDQYNTEQEFINLFLSRLSVTCKPITINHGNLNRQNVQVQVSENINVEIDIEININQKVIRYGRSIIIESLDINMDLEYYKHIETNPTKKQITYYDKELSPDYFKIGNWEIFISDVLGFLYSRDEFNFTYVSFIYNKTKPNKLLMIHELESVIIQNALEETHDPNIILFNMYMTPINRQLLNSADLPQIPIELKVLFSMQNISPFEIFHMFKTHPYLMSRIHFFEQLFIRAYNFTVDNAPAEENRQQFRPNVYEDWEQLFNIPRINNDRYGIKEKMLEFFCNKYSEIYPEEGVVCKSSTLPPVASVVVPFAASSPQSSSAASSAASSSQTPTISSQTPVVSSQTLPAPTEITQRSSQQLSAESTLPLVSSNAPSSQIPTTELPTISSQTSQILQAPTETLLTSFQKSSTQSGLSAPLSATQVAPFATQVPSSTRLAVEQSASLSAALSSNIGRKYKIVGIRIINTTDPNKYQFEGKIVYL